MVTVIQQVQVAKDRAIDELSDIAKNGDGKINTRGKVVNFYGNLSDEVKLRIHQIGYFLAATDDSERTLAIAKKMGFINGEEDLFFEKSS